MEQMDRSAQLRIVILKWDRLYGDMIRRQIWDVWPNAVVRVYQTGLDALAAIQEAMPDHAHERPVLARGDRFDFDQIVAESPVMSLSVLPTEDDPEALRHVEFANLSPQGRPL